MDGRLRFDLIQSKPKQITSSEPTLATKLMTEAEIRELEKNNIQQALAASNGKIYGRDGAAAKLGMKPTTLVSRIKALGGRQRTY